MFLTAHRRTTLIVDVTLLDADGSEAVLDSGDTVHVRVGRSGEQPLLEFEGLGGNSSATPDNPTTITFHEDDLTFTEGVYDVEVWVCDASGNVVVGANVGVFTLHDTQVGEICQEADLTWIWLDDEPHEWLDGEQAVWLTP